MAKNRQLIIVSNRLPLQLKTDGSETKLLPSSGGLVTAVKPVAQKNRAKWFGFLGFKLSPETIKEVRKRAYEPIEIDEDLYSRYYNGYCNGTLWPIMHYFTQTATFYPEDWEAYEKVNRQFAQVIAQKAPLHASIWVHDYHLMLLPATLKRLRPDLFVSYFHHIPFPAVDIARMIPQAETLVDSLLHCDHVGFHTENYVQNFSSTARNLMAAERHGAFISYRGHRCLITANPISIDFDEFDSLSRSERCEKGLGLLKASNYKIILGVDRMDYTKGIIERLEGFRHFLHSHPEWVNRVILLQICVPSRDDVPSYQRLKQRIERFVGEINGTFGTPDYTPVHYFYQSVSRPQLVGLYKIANTMIVSSLRDGMNLVSKEYVAANSLEKGVLILSKFAGSAQQLQESILVNPYDIREISDALLRDLTMPDEERHYRMHRLRHTVRQYNQNVWSHSIFEAWLKSRSSGKKLQVVS
ncbi:MAG: alpha,alpha-trehalose-phosphate synthase (UDP-forming) [Oligoflexus sp.]